MSVKKYKIEHLQEVNNKNKKYKFQKTKNKQIQRTTNNN